MGRKVFLWFASLALVGGMYVLYNRLSETPEIGTGSAERPGRTVTQDDVGDTREPMGTIGQVKVGTVRMAQYTHLDANKQVDRVFGFERLVHEQQDEWEIEKPYMNIFHRDFDCYVTSERGTVQIETAAGRPSPRDVKLTGNVVVHIMPQESSDISESYVYMDDIFFVSEKSEFSTGGPVKFISEDARLWGRGLKFVYNEPMDRLEFLRIDHLKSLRFRDSSPGVFASGTERAEHGGKDKAGPDKQAGRSIEKKAAGRQADTTLRNEQRGMQEREGQYYRCVFDGNVTVEKPRLVIVAARLVLSNILFSSGRSGGAGGSKSGTNNGPPGGRQGRRQLGHDSEDKPVIAGGKTVGADGQAQQPTQDFGNVIVKCDNGVLIEPMDSDKQGMAETASSMQAGLQTHLKALEAATGKRTSFVAERIDYDTRSGRVVATGPAQVRLCRSGGQVADRTAADVVITAQKRTVFMPKSSWVIFEGDSVCTMGPEDANDAQGYRLASPKLTVDISGWGEGGGATAIERMVADGPVNLRIHSRDVLTGAESREDGAVMSISAERRGEFLPGLNRVVFEGNCICRLWEKAGDKDESYTLRSPRLTVNVSGQPGRQSAGRDVRVESLVAAGPMELGFSVDDLIGSGREALPVRITAQRQAEFLPDSNEVVFEGDCVCSMVRADANSVTQYNLSAPVLRVGLSRSRSGSSDSAGRIERVRAGGGLVRLATVKRAGEEFLGGVELKCGSFDYDGRRQVFSAAGPRGVVKVDNSRVSLSGADSGRFSLQRPCYALLRDFDRLEYFVRGNKVVADANSQSILIDYVPVVDGQYGQKTAMTTRHVQAGLLQTPQGRTELSVLRAGGGIAFEQQDMHFEGSELVYEGQTSLMRVFGSDAQACYFNGALVDGIEYDTSSGNVSAEIAGPGALQLGP